LKAIHRISENGRNQKLNRSDLTMSNEEIQALLLRYRLGLSTAEEIAKIHLWYDSLNQNATWSLNPEEKGQLENRMLKNILVDMQEADVFHEAIRIRTWWKSPIWYSGVAAALVLALTYILFFSKDVNKSTIQSQKLFVQASSGKLITYENKSTKAEKITLEDESVVTLSPGSKIIYPDHFSTDKRDVQLVGDAFFEIKKNPKKPFLVYSGKLITRVLGTSFRIKTKSGDKALEVEVVTGKVSVFENNDAFKNTDSIDPALKNNNGVVLTPNQRVTYFPESRHLMTGLVPMPVKIEPAVVMPRKLNFNNASLLQIVRDLQETYGIEIVFANERLEKCSFTGDLSEMPLYEKLDLVCKSNQAQYEVKGTRILISGDGCD
jgi:transmembrane sensor